MSKKLMFMLAALTAVAIMAIPAVAAAEITLETEEEEPVESGSTFTALSENAVGTTEAGNIECAEDDEEGEVEVPSGESVELSISGGSSGAACTTTIGGGGMKIDRTRLNTPWPITLKPNDVAEITKVKYTDTLTLNGNSVGHCTFTAEKNVVIGSYTTFPNPLQITVAGAPFEKVAISSPGCPPKVLLDAVWDVTQKGKDLFVK